MPDDLTTALLALIVAAIPTILVGLTRYPRALSIVIVLTRPETLRLLRGLWRVLNALSVATHRDSPGTFKAPLTMSQHPPREGAP